MAAPAGSRDPLDSIGFLEAVKGLPEQLAAAHEAAASLDAADFPAASEVDHIAVLGMGGSGVAGDVLAAVAGPVVAVPVTVHRQYHLPGFIGPRTLPLAN